MCDKVYRVDCDSFEMFINQVKATNDIVAIIGKHLKLDRKLKVPYPSPRLAVPGGIAPTLSRSGDAPGKSP